MFGSFERVNISFGCSQLSWKQRQFNPSFKSKDLEVEISYVSGRARSSTRGSAEVKRLQFLPIAAFGCIISLIRDVTCNLISRNSTVVTYNCINVSKKNVIKNYAILSDVPSVSVEILYILQNVLKRMRDWARYYLCKGIFIKAKHLTIGM